MITKQKQIDLMKLIFPIVYTIRLGDQITVVWYNMFAMLYEKGFIIFFY